MLAVLSPNSTVLGSAQSGHDAWIRDSSFFLIAGFVVKVILNQACSFLNATSPFAHEKILQGINPLKNFSNLSDILSVSGLVSAK